jgi:hypothetical protein
LVVDTGIHAKHWTREQAIAYMREKTGMGEKEVKSEIERYIVAPGQACAYKIGMLKIQELRVRAQKELGEKFDQREFHDAVLKNGALPLEILEEQVNEYIQQKKRRIVATSEFISVTSVEAPSIDFPARRHSAVTTTKAANAQNPDHAGGSHLRRHYFPGNLDFLRTSDLAFA